MVNQVKISIDSPFPRFAGSPIRLPIGGRVNSREDVERALQPLYREYTSEIDRNIIDTFVANLHARRLLDLDNRNKS